MSGKSLSIEQPPTDKVKHPQLDGLRGIAILLVICSHNFGFIPFFFYGWVGVDLFFVLSGFLITSGLLRTSGDKNFIKKFFIKRVLRIFPLYYLALIILFILILATPFFTSQRQYITTHPFLPFLHLVNWNFIIHKRTSYDLLISHFWSLSLEEQFYFTWPFLVYFFRPPKVLKYSIFIILALAILSRLISWIILGNGYYNFTFQDMTRIDGLCIGSLIAIGRKIEDMNLIKRLILVILVTFFVLAIITKIYSLALSAFQVLGYTSIAALWGWVILMILDGRIKVLSQILNNESLKWIGKISYGIYIFHWPILVTLKTYTPNLANNITLSTFSKNLLIGCASFFLTIFIGAVSFTFFEKKFLALKPK